MVNRKKSSYTHTQIDTGCVLFCQEDIPHENYDFQRLLDIPTFIAIQFYSVARVDGFIKIAELIIDVMCVGKISQA